MLTAHLYNNKSNQLRPLDKAELLSCTPTPDEAAEKQSQQTAHPTGLVSHAPPQCRHNEMLWVDCTAPTEEEIELIGKRFNVHPMVMEDIRSREDRPKLHDYKDYLYIIFHSVSEVNNIVSTPATNPANWLPDKPVSEPTGSAGTPSSDPANTAKADRFEVSLNEIDCLVGPDFVVTLHAEAVPPFEDLRSRWKRRPELMKAGTAHLLYELMDEVLDDYFPLLDSLDERIDEFEDRLFTNFQDGLSTDIFSLKRSLLQIRRVAGPTRDVVNMLLRHNAESGGQHFAYFQDLYDHAVRIVDMIDTFRDILSGALDAYLALESNRTNAVMKTLTAASIILLLPTLIAGIYGMNFKNMPELNNPNGYYMALGLMGFTVASLVVYFKRKQWL